ncbi:MAG TPA: hypothetical protein VE569_04970 [Acidimicrobiia bacterium]|nr:hypothetical protein [Acidimicrobiia bacterium]
MSGAKTRVWGEDESLGNFSNSLNMNGTGILQHDVLLPGAVPGVEYKFVGSGHDGRWVSLPLRYGDLRDPGD